MDTQKHDIPELLNRLQSEDPAERLETVIHLSQSGGEESIAGLVMALEDDDAAVREQTAECLSKLRGDTATALLSEFLGNPNIRTRNLAAEILVSIGADAVSGLIGWITHEDHDVRKFVVDTLGLIGDPRGAEALKLALWDENINVCCGAAEALGLIAEPSTTGALIAAA